MNKFITVSKKYPLNSNEFTYILDTFYRSPQEKNHKAA